MSEERIPQLITVYRALLFRSRSAYLRRARFFLPVPNLLVGGIAFLLVSLSAAEMFFIAWFQSLPLLLILLFAAALSLPVARILSFRRALSRTPNIFLTEQQKPSAAEGIMLGLITFLVLSGTASLLKNSPTAHIVLTIFGTAILLYVFQAHLLLKEVLRYYTRIPVSEGTPIPAGPEGKLRQEYAACAAAAPGTPSVTRFFLTNITDLQIGVVKTEGGKKGGRVVKKSLALGLPLLQSVTPEQFRAYLLSECLSHTTPAGRLFHRYTDRYVAWNRFLHHLSTAFHWGEKLYLPFNESVLSRLTAHLFLVSRIARQEADQEVADRGYLAPLQDALANQSYKHRLIEKSVWSDMYRKADDTGTTTLDPFAAIQGELSGRHDREEAKLVLNESMIDWNDGVALVPTPSERLTLLQVNATVPEQGGASAAEYYFGDRIGEIIGAADTSWNKTFFTTYGELLTRRQEAREELEGVIAEIERTKKGREKERGILFWRAGQIREGLAEEEHDLDAALDLYRNGLSVDPGSSLLRFSVARMLLARNREEGLELLRVILQSDEMGEERLHAYTMVLEHMRNNAMEEEAKKIEEEHLTSFTRTEETLNLHSHHAQQERGNVDPADTLVGHGLDGSTLRHFLRILKRYQHVRSALLVRKHVRYFPEYPFYLLGLEIVHPPSRGFLDPGGPILYAQQVAEELQFLRGGIGVILFNPVDQLSRRLQSHPDAQIYKREG